MITRYFITDETNIGTLISGQIMPKEMILILGKKIYEHKNISDIISFMIEKFYFKIEAENISFIDLNSGKYPYTFYDLISEGICDPDGYSYANISEIKKHFLGCEKMLSSLNLISFMNKKIYCS